MNLICRVQFDASEVEAGGQLSGRLRLLENGPSVAKARRLQLRAVCRAEGPGEPESRVLNTAEIPGPFTPQTDLPFRIPIPETGPITYQGVILHLRWHLEVQLLVPDEFSPQYETAFQVVPARPSSERRRHPKAPPTRR
ncbi:MAG TPA: hypothetical protein VF815_20230 [Myxococcaceae bacterium]|jgi:hypothetical protein